LPGNVPPVADEREGLLAFLAQQRYALRLAAHGLTDEQARVAPTTSALSIGGLIKHVTATERGWMDTLLQRPSAESGESGEADYVTGFTMTADETLAGILDSYEQAARETEDIIAGIADLGQPVPVPKGVPWFPDDVDAWSVRWVLLHLIEETGPPRGARRHPPRMPRRRHRHAADGRGRGLARHPLAAALGRRKGTFLTSDLEGAGHAAAHVVQAGEGVAAGAVDGHPDRAGVAVVEVARGVRARLDPDVVGRVAAVVEHELDDARMGSHQGRREAQVVSGGDVDPLHPVRAGGGLDRGLGHGRGSGDAGAPGPTLGAPQRAAGQPEQQHDAQQQPPSHVDSSRPWPR
jgi:Protein of unknown function (DUF664)